MINFKNRIPKEGKANLKKLTFLDDNTTRLAKVEYADEGENGTPINRSTMMALQGMENSQTSIAMKNSITITNENSDGITTTNVEIDTSGIRVNTAFQAISGERINALSQITFNIDGSISIRKDVI